MIGVTILNKVVSEVLTEWMTFAWTLEAHVPDQWHNCKCPDSVVWLACPVASFFVCLFLSFYCTHFQINHLAFYIESLIRKKRTMKQSFENKILSLARLLGYKERNAFHILSCIIWSSHLELGL